MSKWAWPALGNWHVLKMVKTCIWRLAGASFLAPFFHSLFPRSYFPSNPRFIFVTRMLSLIRLSYPQWKAELDEAITVLLPRTPARKHAENLRYLVEFLIPTVSFDFECEISFASTVHDI